MYEDVRETKIPLFEKFRDEAPRSAFTKLYVNSMVNKTVQAQVEINLDEQRLVREEWNNTSKNEPTKSISKYF